MQPQGVLSLANYCKLGLTYEVYTASTAQCLPKGVSLTTWATPLSCLLSCTVRRKAHPGLEVLFLLGWAEPLNEDHYNKRLSSHTLTFNLKRFVCRFPSSACIASPLVSYHNEFKQHWAAKLLAVTKILLFDGLTITPTQAFSAEMNENKRNALCQLRFGPNWGGVQTPETTYTLDSRL